MSGDGICFWFTFGSAMGFLFLAARWRYLCRKAWAELDKERARRLKLEADRKDVFQSVVGDHFCVATSRRSVVFKVVAVMPREGKRE